MTPLPQSAPVFFNGQPQSAVPPLDDRGFAYGDGLFETMRLQQGAIPLWRWHYQRLSKGLRALALPRVDEVLLDKELHQFIDHFDLQYQEGVIKLMVTAGSVSYGYLRPEHCELNRVLLWRPLAAIQQQHNTGLSMIPSTVRLSRQPLLAGIKHLNRLEYVLAGVELARSTADNCLLFDDQGYLIEALMSNIFIIKEQCIKTPVLDQCGVQGVMRQVLIEYMESNAFGADYTVSQTPLTFKDLLDSDGSFICNSVRGIEFIGNIQSEGNRVQQWPIHPVALQLKHRVDQILMFQ